MGEKVSLISERLKNYEEDHKNSLKMEDQMMSDKIKEYGQGFICNVFDSDSKLRLFSLKKRQQNKFITSTSKKCLESLFKLLNRNNMDFKKKIVKENIFSNKPTSIQQCNVDQIVYILNHHIFDNLKEKIKQLQKQMIIQFITKNKID